MRFVAGYFGAGVGGDEWLRFFGEFEDGFLFVYFGGSIFFFVLISKIFIN